MPALPVHWKRTPGFVQCKAVTGNGVTQITKLGFFAIVSHAQSLCIRVIMLTAFGVTVPRASSFNSSHRLASERAAIGLHHNHGSPHCGTKHGLQLCTADASYLIARVFARCLSTLDLGRGRFVERFIDLHR